GEMVDQYAADMAALFRRVTVRGNEYLESMKAQIFVQGLQPDLALAMGLFMPGTLQAAIERARVSELLFSKSMTMPNTIPFVNPTVTYLQQPMIELNKSSTHDPVEDSVKKLTTLMKELVVSLKNNNNMATEFFTKWPEAGALPGCKAESVAFFLVNEIISRHGCPLEIITDQAAALEIGEEIILNCNHVMLKTADQEISEYILASKKKMQAEKIRENIYKYLLDLNHENPLNPIMLLETPGEKWNERLANVSWKIFEMNLRIKLNGYILEVYYRMESILAEKRWNEAAKRELRSYFKAGRSHMVLKISKRVYQLFVTHGEWHILMVEHINISILEKMYDEDFIDRLLVEACTQRKEEIDQ
ncbi:982_t:CDS:2, partial [Cetraspora pellucida]